MVKYIVVIAFSVTLLGSVVPVIQFFVHRGGPSQKAKRYFFDVSLFEKVLNENLNAIQGQLENRVALGDRGWVRKPMGTVLGKMDFEEKKKQEYEIELP